MNGLDVLSNLLVQEEPIQNNSINPIESYLKKHITEGKYEYINELISFYESNNCLFQALPYYGLAFKIFPNDLYYIKRFIDVIKPNPNNLDLVIFYLTHGFETGNSECMIVCGNLCLNNGQYMNMKKYYNMAISFNRTDALISLIEYYLEHERDNRAEYIQNLIKVFSIYQKTDISNQNSNAQRFQKYKLALIDYYKGLNDIENIIICHKIGIRENHTQSYLNLIEHYLYVEKDMDNAKKYVIELYESNEKQNFIESIILAYIDVESKYEMFEFLCMIGVALKNIFCMQKLATKTFIKKNYRNAFVCNLAIIINTENTTSKLVIDSVGAISNIIYSIKKEIPNPKSYFEVLSNNIEYLKNDIPNTHKIIIQKISNILNNNIKFYS
jgi:hypothetical protein